MNILQLFRRPVYPPQDGETVRVWKTARKLAELGDLWLAGPPADGTDPPEECTEIELDTPFLTRRVLRNEAWLGLFLLSETHPLQRLLTDAIVAAVDEQDVTFDVVVPEFPQVTGAGCELAAEHGAKLLLNKHNADYEILDSFLERRPVPGFVRRRAVANLRAFERRSVARADVAVFQSEADRDRFRDIEGTETKVIPNGCEYEHIREGGDPDSVARRLGIDPESFVCVFLGSYTYQPNLTAASVIADELAPALPGIEFVLVGRDPPETTRENVYTPGYVDDLAGVLGLADVALCPLFSGSGTKLKMLDYFAAGVPVVSTPVGIQGLPVEDGREALVYDSVSGIREGIERLVESPSLRETLARNGQEIAADHSWESLMARYEAVFEELFPGSADVRHLST